MSFSRRFYEMMKYPVPIRKEFFSYQSSTTQIDPQRPLLAMWSRLGQPSAQMQTMIAYLTHFQRIRSWIPFVESVYLSNSMTFNAVHPGSNIDLFVITTPGRLWSARCWLLFLWKCVRLVSSFARSQSLSFNFMLSRDHQDMSTLLLYPSDPYLVYRLAHLVPLYHRDFSYQDEIYGHNQRLQYYLPQFAFRQTIFLGIEASVGASRIKQFYERVHNGLRGSLIELVSRGVYTLCLKRWAYRHPRIAEHLFIGTDMLRLYDDKRKRYSLMWEVYSK